MYKRLLVVAVALFAAILLFAGSPTDAQAQSAIAGAKSYTIGTQASGAITENGPDKQYYCFTLGESGAVHLTGTVRTPWVFLRLYDANAEELVRDNKYWNSTSELIPLDETLYLTSGTYYFCIDRDGSNTGTFTFKIDFSSSNESFTEVNGGSNNSLATASRVSANGTSYNAQLALNDTKDFWRFHLGESGRVQLGATFYDMRSVDWALYDESGNELVDENYNYQNDTTKNIVLDESLYLTSGTYYLCFERDGYDGRYTFSLPFVSSNESFSEVNGGSNNSIASASSLSLGQVYKGAIDINDDRDFYRLTLPKSASYTVSLDAACKYLRLVMFDASGEEIWNDVSWQNDNTGKIVYSKVTTLERGTYYLAVEDYGADGDYSLSVSALTQENCPHESYDTSYRSATYFSRGYTLYTCRVCGYSYRADYTPKLAVPSAYIYSCKAGKKKIALRWYWVSNISGYQIRYAKKKSMKGAKAVKVSRSKTSKTIKKLSKKKRYYVQIRTYVKSGKKVAYSSWSPKKRVKTK